MSAEKPGSTDTCISVQTCARHTCSCTHGLSSQDALCLPTHLSSQVVARGQVLEAVQAVPVASSSTAGVMVDHLAGAGVSGWKEGLAGEGEAWRGGAPQAWRALGGWLWDPLWPVGCRGAQTRDGWGWTSHPRGGGGAQEAQGCRGGLGPRRRKQGSDLHLPEGIGAGGRGGGLAQRGAQEHLQLALVYSSHVRNFSCSAWNSRTTSPCRRQGVGSGQTRTLPGEEPTCLRYWRSSFLSQQAKGGVHT